MLFIIFSSHEKIGIMGEENNQEDSSFSHIGTFFLFLSARKNNSLLSLLRNGSSLIYPFVIWCFYKVLFESISLILEILE